MASRFYGNDNEMKNELVQAVLKIIQKKWPETKIKKEDIEINYPPEKFGDYSCNVALKLAKKLNKQPREIAQRIKKELEKKLLEELKKIEMAGPGFLNFYLKEKYLQNLIEKINSQKEKFGSNQTGKNKKIHMDFVSANPTGPIHLGNGRGGPYGDALANILQKCGYKVWREYYVNDYGNQVKILGHSVLKDEEAQYKGDYIDKLHKELKKNRSSFAKATEDKPFKVGQWAANEILREIIQPSMERLGIKFDDYFSEKSLHEAGKIEETFKTLEEKKLIYKKEDALWFKARQFGDEKDRVIKKSDGTVTYFGADIANHKDRFGKGADKVIDIWGADHHGDVKRVLGAMEALGFKGKVEIILTQFVRVIKDGEEVKMSKRKGTYISVRDLLDEVGEDAVRFFFLMYSNNTHINFDIDLAKEKSEKNPVYYVQYAHARISSILRQDTITKRQGTKKIDYKLIKHPKELELLKHLNKFPELIIEMAASREVHALPNYLIQLADKFHSFYGECQVIDEKNKNLTLARLELAKAVKIVLAEGLRLIGVSAPEKM